MCTMFEMLAATIAQVVAQGAADGVSAMPEKRTADRTQRIATYAALQHSVVRAQLRDSTLASVHAAQYNPAHVAACISGFPLLVGLLNQLTDDLAQVVCDWQRVRLVASPAVDESAERLVVALCAVVACVDPGWIRPRARGKYRQTLEIAKQELLAASSAFDRAARADAAPRRKDRRAALASVTDLDDSDAGPRTARSAARRPGTPAQPAS